MTKGIRRDNVVALKAIYVALKKECYIQRGNLTIDGECRSLKTQDLAVRVIMAKIYEHVDKMEDTENKSVRDNNAKHYFIDWLSQDDVEFVHK